MRKKLSISLAPVLAAAAFVAIPAVARATPHYYAVGIKLAEGKTYPTLSWGTLAFSTSDVGIPLSCESAAVGDAKNPIGEGAGEGETDAFMTTDCADEECPEEDGFEIKIHSGDLPWPSMLVESGTTNLLETRGVEIVVGCYLAHSETLVAAATTCKGNWDPEFRDGSGNLSQIVSKVSFTAEHDRLECVTVTEEGELKGEAVTEKALNVTAYGSPVPVKKVEPETANTARATVEVKNP